MDIHRKTAEPWHVILIDTGEETQTGGRAKRVLPHIGDDTVFALTNGDGVANIDINGELAFDREHGREATVTAVLCEALRRDSPGRRSVFFFVEKPNDDGGLD
jgi:glucose-1-phosphate cytidylyltransferase